MMKYHKIIIQVLIGCLLFTAGFVAGKYCRPTQQTVLPEEETVEHQVKSVTERGMQAQGETPLSTRTVFVPICREEGITYDKPAAHDSADLSDRAQNYASGFLDGGGDNNFDGGGDASSPTLAVEIPIVQREYAGEDYRAWVSGYDPRLDSIRIYSRSDIVTRTVSVPGKTKRWGLGVSAGYGYTPQGFQPFVGVTLNYNILNF